MSETMNADKVMTFYECIRTIIKHFQCSVKDTEILDTFVAILELGERHLISWCATRMAHFLEACDVLNSIIVALYHAMYQKGRTRFQKGRTKFTILT